MAPVVAAVLPHPPLLVPELAGTAAAELDPLRAACREALTAVVTTAELTILVGDGPVWGVPEPSAPGSFGPYGVAVQVTLPAATGDLDLPDLPAPARLPDLPLSLAVAAHLLANLDPPPGADRGTDRPLGAGRMWAATVPRSLSSRAAAAVGRALTAAARNGPAGGGPVGLVVMADLSACRTERAPGAFRAAAADVDASVAEALRTGELTRLLDLDPGLATDLLIGGRVPLQVLAGAFGSEPTVHGRVLYEDAPYGVGYLVALLTAP